ncbi:PilZ domain-containing protein [Allorhizobium terrae]|uniref:PilZ domain-containing protein n=1 Tax=Allorhizobium terrae TaxID=1848972 RepID=A0A4S4A6V1_9HYPH|nr:PilZ domain-containing protein [Allorhizobium terrae]THF54094.1 PilZ domain-containing protein [Allorhizobium terrae]TWD58023.1 PilZ domain-containing protein [Agrobacterium vitis]
MYSFQQTQKSETERRQVQRAFQRVSVSLEGRLMVPSQDEYVCLTVDMSPGDVRFICAARPVAGDRIIAYIDNIGRIEGSVVKTTDDGFVISIVATDRKREKLAAQLTWIANKHELGLPEDRRHDRLTPRKARAELTLDDGQKFSCRIIDLSLSGAAVEMEYRPAMGTAVRLGNTRGRVVRHFLEGVAIEFTTLQSRDSLKDFL